MCRTTALGIDIYASTDRGEIWEISHSCKRRFCPSCGWRDTLKWAARMKEKILRVPHRHVVMTLSHNSAFGTALTDAGAGDTICRQVFQAGVSERVQDYGNGR